MNLIDTVTAILFEAGYAEDYELSSNLTYRFSPTYRRLYTTGYYNGPPIPFNIGNFRNREGRFYNIRTKDFNLSLIHI